MRDRRLLVIVAWLVMAAARSASAAPVRVALVPLRESGVDSPRLERALVDAIATVPALSLANVGPGGKLSGARRMPMDVRADPQSPARAQALGREHAAARVLLVDQARLGDGNVVYLQAIDTASGRSVASTTVPMASGAAVNGERERDLLRAAVVRVLAPALYVGRLVLRVDVAAAEAQVDGRRVTQRTLDLPVGTHALRITHPAYHDYLRFVEVEFDRAQTLDVALSAYPLAEGEMFARARRMAPVALPWYRKWWVLGGAAVVLAGATATAVLLARPGVNPDQTLFYKSPVAP